MGQLNGGASAGQPPKFMEKKPDQKTGVQDYFGPQSQKEINQTVKQEHKN